MYSICLGPTIQGQITSEYIALILIHKIHQPALLHSMTHHMCFTSRWLIQQMILDLSLLLSQIQILDIVCI